MKRCLAIAVLALLAAAGQAADDVDLPVLREDQLYERQFTVTNPYERAIRIKVIDATCTCSTLELDRRFLLPGASATLSMAADNRNLSGIMRRRVWFYSTDPEYEAIEVKAEWRIRPMVFIDLLPPGTTSTDERPEQRAWHDIYRYTADVRPDELGNLRKIMRIGCPPEEMPEGGLEIGPIDYAGDIWRFETKRLDERHWLLIGSAADPDNPPEEGIHQESVQVHVNHPDKPVLKLEFLTRVSPEAGSGEDPFADYL